MVIKCFEALVGNGFEPSPPQDKNRFKILHREIAEFLGQRVTFGALCQSGRATLNLRVVQRSAGCLSEQSCPSVTSKRRFLVLRSSCDEQLLRAVEKAAQVTLPWTRCALA